MKNAVAIYMKRVTSYFTSLHCQPASW